MSQPLQSNLGTSGLHRPRQELQRGSTSRAEAVPSNQVMHRNRAQGQDPASPRAFRDITNTTTESRASADEEKKQGDAAAELHKALHNASEAPSASECQRAKRRRQLPVSSSHVHMRRQLPSSVIATILEMAGLKSEGPEFTYADANLKNDLQREYQVMPCRRFMSEQRSLNGRMRAILIDWIVQVLDMSRLSQRTLFLTVSLIDRCLSCMQVDRSNLQLLGSTAFLIAAKVEEIHPPEVANLVYICDGAYTTENLLEMECTILQKLDFRVDGPTAEHFLPHFISVGLSQSNLGPDPMLFHGVASLWHYQCRNEVAWYLAELALLDDQMSQYPPSQVSASALYLANHLITRPNYRVVYAEVALWNDTMAEATGYTEPMLLRCAGDLDKLRTAAQSDSVAQQINRRHDAAVNAIRHAIFQPSKNDSGSPPYASMASAVPYPS
jgi:hypothetical protein